MKQFFEPELEIVELEIADVITTSVPEEGENDLGWG